SEEFCGTLDKTGPVMTNVSVENTSTTDGEMFVAWSPPTILDEDVFPGPYTYRLYHDEGFTSAFNEILVTPERTSIDNPDTLFTHTGINTLETPHAYRVELYSGEDLIQASGTASSIFLELIPDDNEITLTMNFSVQWQNLSYEIFRFNNDIADFELITTTDEPIYVDTGLTNNVQYCYYVRAVGTYAEPSIIDPLINLSQEACAEPIDFTPPCAPELTVTPDCESEITFLQWNNPNNFCADDVIGYNIYYAPTDTAELQLLTTINDATDTTFTFNESGDLNTIAGCFAVTALDSLLTYDGGFQNQNESELSETFCVDNCPVYELPNVFTPNNNGFNDLFIPFPYRYVDSIQITIFNRWGGIVFETGNPDILWDGKDQETNEVVSDGTYFYFITIFDIRLQGIFPREQSGIIQVLAGQNQTNN
ncbi:MAG: gliding motility-associated C-terminal domain-containing protein, partial [Flavobacteriales bacterium]|nr:gliding motility-associated C-terminal domain-containing protein [Flavobacteriales bacterium]